MFSGNVLETIYYKFYLLDPSTIPSLILSSRAAPSNRRIDKQRDRGAEESDPNICRCYITAWQKMANVFTQLVQAKAIAI